MSAAKTNVKMTGLESNAGYVEARDRLDSLRRDLAACEAELTAAVAAGARLRPAVSRVERQAQELATGGPVDAGPDLAAIEARHTVLSRAVELAEKQCAGIWAEASDEVVRQRRQEHVELVERIGDALRILTAAVRVEQDWWDGLRDAGVHARPGLGGTASYTTPETRELFRLLRGFRIDPWLQQLQRAGYKIGGAK